MNKRSTIFFKSFTKFWSIKWNGIYQFRFSIFFYQEFVYREKFTTFIIYNFISKFHLFWNQEINLRNEPQPIWNIYCTKHVVFLFSDCRTNIFFSWLFVRPSWLFNIFHIWNSMFWRAFLWKQRRQVVFLWFRCPLIHKKTIKKEQSESDCKYWKINGKCKIDSRKNQSFFIVGCLIPKCLFFRKSNHDVFFHFCGFVRYKIILMFILYLYFLQFQVNFYFFIWQIWFSLIVYVSLYMHSKFSICLSRRFVYQDKLSLDNHHLIDVDHSTGRCLFCLVIIDKVIFHLSIKRSLCWTLILAWMFQQLQHHRTFIHIVNLLGGLRLNNNQTRQSWLNNPTDLTDQRVAVRSQIRKYKTQPKPKFPWLFSTNKIKQCFCSLFLFIFVTVFSFIIRLDVSNPNQFPSNFVRLSCFMIQRQRLFSKTCGSVFNLSFSLQPFNSFQCWNPSCDFFTVNRCSLFYMWNDSEMFHFCKNGIFNRWQIQFRNDRRTMSFLIKQNQFFKHVNIPCVQFVRVCGNNISTTFASLWIFHFFIYKRIKTFCGLNRLR